MKIFLLSLILTVISLAAGCVNMPTKSSLITGAYVSEDEYKDWKCDRLTKEYNLLEERENMLADAQEQRYRASQTQAIFLGFGQGDGIEAAELAAVRGKLEALYRAKSHKTCSG